MPSTPMLSIARFVTFGAVAAALAFVNLRAHAITPTGDKAGPLPRSAKPTAFAPPTAAIPTAAPLELIAGTITAVDRNKKTMTIAGNTVAWHTNKLRVFGATGAGMSDRELAPGMRVRFAFEPGTKDGRTVVLIYVDALS